jgi:hypothetical protein
MGRQPIASGLLQGRSRWEPTPDCVALAARTHLLTHFFSAIGDGLPHADHGMDKVAGVTT